MEDLNIVRSTFQQPYTDKDKFSDSVIEKSDPLDRVLMLIIEQEDLVGNLVKVREIITKNWDNLTSGDLSLLWRLIKNSHLENDPVIRKLDKSTRTFVTYAMENIADIFQLVILNRETKQTNNTKIASIVRYIQNTHRNINYLMESKQEVKQ